MDTIARINKKLIATSLVFLVFIISEIVCLLDTEKKTCIPGILRDWYLINQVIAITGIWIIQRAGIATFLQESLINGIKFLLCVIWADTFFNNLGLINDPYYNLIIFICGSGFAVAILLYQLLKPHERKWKILTIASLAIFLFLLVEFAVHITFG